MTTLYQLPTPTESNQTLRAELDGTTYLFKWIWLERDGHWSMSLYTSDGEAIASGLRVVVGWDLLKDVRIPITRPPGSIVLLDESTSSATPYGQDPAEDDLGSRVFAYYIPIQAASELTP